LTLNQQEAEKPDHPSRILDAASHLFLELGFEKTSTADIARRARVSKREIYTHFADKRAILSAAITKLQNRMGSEMAVEWSATGDLRSVLLHAGTAIFNFIVSEKFRNVFRIVAAESFHDPEAARKFYLLGPAAGRQQTAKFLDKHMKNGSLRKADALQAADDFLDLVITARFMTVIALGRTDRAMTANRHVAHAVDVFLTYYAPNASESQAKPGRKPRGQRT
jgi:TetR/AcrR family transcriptional regulator, mexJK operon transcriptional repressor